MLPEARLTLYLTAGKAVLEGQGLGGAQPRESSPVALSPSLRSLLG